MSRLFIPAVSEDATFELWVTDGTEGGTRALIGPSADTDLRSNTDYTSLNPRRVGILDSERAVFEATDLDTGWGLAVTDGTTEGTQVVFRLPDAPTESFSIPQSFTSLGDGRVMFAANDGTHGTSLWVTDGTPEGTQHLPALRVRSNDPLEV
ncbi:hypothetical protein, partial [Limnospira sp. PMC 1042.18]